MDKKEEQSALGKLEQLESDVARLMRESRDLRFSEYLKSVQGRLITQEYQADLLRDELERNYQIYKRLFAGQEAASQTPADQNVEAMVPKASVDQNEEPMRQEQQEQSEQLDRLEQPEQPRQSGNYVYQAVPVSTVNIAPAAGQQPSVNQQPFLNQQPPVNKPPRKKNVEFIIGATLFGVIGGSFILTALVLLGMNYMTGIVKGVSLYGVCLVVLLLSELWIYRKVPRLGIILSSVAIGGLHVVTAVNFLSLKILNMWAAFAITFVVAVTVIFLSRKRNSIVYRIIGLVATYLSFLMLQSGMSTVEFLIVSAMILLVSILFILLPVQAFQTVFRIVHIYVNAVFAIAFVWRAQVCGVEDEVVLIYQVAAMAVLHALFAAQVLYRQKLLSAAEEGQVMKGNGGVIAAYCISGLVQLFDMGTLIYSLFPSGRILSLPEKSDWVEVQGALASTSAHAVMLGILVICIVTFFVLWRKKCPEKWFVYYFWNVAVCAVYAWATGTLCYVVLTALMVVAKLLSLRRIRAVRVCDAIITTFVCITLILDPQPAILLIGIAVGILCLSQWKTYHEIVMTAALVLYAAPEFPASIRLPVAMGILFVGILLFHNVKRWRDGQILVFYLLALFGQVICLLLLCNPVYRNAYITYLFMLIFGLATIVLTFHEKYGMPVKIKNLVLAVFLTYMAVVFRINEPIVNSILLMVIALVCVAIGFAERQKSTRIYGLALSLVVCGKIVLYDFMENPVLQRTILFFAVGVIALIIAGIYIILEKKANAAVRMESAEDAGVEDSGAEDVGVEDTDVEDTDAEEIGTKDIDVENVEAAEDGEADAQGQLGGLD
ncbi:MAG: hypothetical protein NC417_03230 [Candidatus Gastranaerophilales bacterium]|nr:hypothetical protein [Candidatus Gastranaerophilales bacterium]